MYVRGDNSGPRHDRQLQRSHEREVYVYSLKEGINDGFLTPFKVKQIATTLDDYVGAVRRTLTSLSLP
jgi:type I site-specific restriction endonuclease